ncbi:unnamed protein product, partial [Urochloa humidicola]
VVQPEKETEYEMQRNANILANEKRIQKLNLRALSHEVSSPLKKKKKAARVVGSEDVIGRNILSSTRLTAARVGLQAGNANAEEPVGALHVQEKKKVRGPTKKANIFAWQNKPKLKVEINEYGQPCGDSSTEFANFIGALVRTKGFPLAADDWRKVEARHKYKLWTDAQKNVKFRPRSLGAPHVEMKCYIRGHTHKNGVPQKGSETTI